MNWQLLSSCVLRYCLCRSNCCLLLQVLLLLL